MIVLDTSGLLAIADSDQEDHQAVIRAIQSEAAPFLLAPFVLAELDDLLMTWRGVAIETDVLREVARGVYDRCRGPSGGHDVDRAVPRSSDRAGGPSAVIAPKVLTTRLLTLDERHFRAVKPLWGSSFTLLRAVA